MERCRTGDIGSFEILYRAHAGDAVRMAFFVTRDWAAAEDATQEAFVRAFRSMRKLRQGWPFAPWLHRIVVNEARRVAQRRSKAAVPVASVWETPAVSSMTGSRGIGGGDAGDPEKIALKDEKRRLLWRAVLDLPEPYRLPVILKYHRDLSEAEIGAMLGIPVGRVKSRLYDARQRLKKALGHWLLEE